MQSTTCQSAVAQQGTLTQRRAEGAPWQGALAVGRTGGPSSHQHGQSKGLDKADCLGVAFQRQAEHAQAISHQRVRSCIWQQPGSTLSGQPAGDPHTLIMCKAEVTSPPDASETQQSAGQLHAIKSARATRIRIWIATRQPQPHRTAGRPLPVGRPPSLCCTEAQNSNTITHSKWLEDLHDFAAQRAGH